VRLNDQAINIGLRERKLGVREREEEMNKTELSKFKKILETKQAELEQIVRKRDAITIEKSADALDEVQHASERELAIRNLDRESNLLRNVRGALRRINDGSFGVCLHCEEEISPKRLAAVPWTALCIQCQEQADKNREEGNEEVFEDMLVSAA
jgi:DnaK suppressor protein